jgi:hypothetical protein
MNQLILASLSLTLTVPALAEERVQFYNFYNQPNGSAVRDGNQIKFYDFYGQPTGSATISDDQPPATPAAIPENAD